jgi:DNA-binding NarL/FixJ family response regulator
MSNEKKRVRIWIIEDESHYRNQLAKLISLDESIECDKTFESFEDALPSFGNDELPDILLLDLNLPGMHGLEVIRELAQSHPAIQILVLTVDATRKTVFDAICAGASGYLIKDDPYEDILRGVHQVMEGGAPLSSSIASYVLETFQDAPPKSADEALSDRETEILQKLADGETRKEIAASVHVAVTTVDYHLRAIYVKLHVHSTAGAVGKALRDRLIE